MLQLAACCLWLPYIHVQMLVPTSSDLPYLSKLDVSSKPTEASCQHQAGSLEASQHSLGYSM